jgi:hypothetical protein
MKFESDPNSCRRWRGSLVVMCGAVALLGTAGCGRERDRRDGRSGFAEDEALAATPAVRQTVPYTPRALEAFGRLSGSVEIDGAPPADSTIIPTSDQAVCGLSVVRRGIERRGNRAAGVVVWIDGLRSGKPLPIERRFEITNDRCALVPEVQPAIAGGTLNVRSLDAVLHRTRVVRQDGGDVLASIRETDEGQVVPDDRVLVRPGVLELSCEVHPWTRGWIAVFDHPYFAMSATDGSFAIDSIPPGRYRVRAWHPRLGPVEDSVTVTAGGDTHVVLRARARL